MPPTFGVDVYVEEADQNVPETARGKSTVMVECLDQAGRAVARAQQPWPFTDTDGGQLEPHVHVTLPPKESQRVRRCRLAGTKGPLEGTVTGLR